MSEPFDFDAFIRGTSLARRTVSAYRVDNRDEIDRLKAEYEAAPEGGDERESATTTTREELAQRITALRAEMEASRVQWVIRTLTPQEFADLDEDVFKQIGLQSRPPADCVNPSLYNDLPNLTDDQWRQIAAVLGSAQWGALVRDANALVISRVAVPDFSPNGSATQRQSEPSGS